MPSRVGVCASGASEAPSLQVRHLGANGHRNVVHFVGVLSKGGRQASVLRPDIRLVFVAQVGVAEVGRCCTVVGGV